MRDLYEALGITAHSTQEAIKRAYRSQARLFHPDVGGSHERMTVINQAYATLSNPEARRQFDQRRTFFQDDETAATTNDTTHECLSASGVRYSQAFKVQHTAFVQQFSQKPLTALSARHHFNPLGPNRYQRTVLVPLFKTLAAHLKGETSGVSGECLSAVLNILSDNPSGEQDYQLLLNVIYRIAQYAVSVTVLPMPLLNLFQHKHFRLLFQDALHDYWCDNTFILDKNILQTFDGRARTHAFLEQLKTTLINQSTNINDGLKNSIQAIRLLRQFETDLRKDDALDRSAEAYREAAYTVLDWVPAFAGKMPTGLMANLLMQAGLYFQCASQVEKIPALQMADEKLAQDLYVSTFNVGHHATPDVELYHLMHGLKYLGAFRYTDPTLPLLIKAFQHRAFLLADVFPFYQPLAANIHFLVEADQQLGLMRQLLQQLVAHLDTQDLSPSVLLLDHPEAVIRYRAYEACVKGWYEQAFNPKTEASLRVALMHTLLADRGLDFSAVEDTLALPTPHIKRDEQAWLQSYSMFDETETEVRNTFSSIDGFEVDYKQGRFTLLATPCNKNTPDCFRSLHVSDLFELFQKNIDAAMFSLDPVDPDMDYHPFNALWFKPERLYQSRLLDTLLATDYLLKFLTVGQEVQGAYPFGQRSLEKLTQHLPKYLKQIIDDFHAAQHSESLHRFWIEAESLPITIEDKALASQGIQTFHLYDVNMQVKKHVLKRDPEGKLIDAAEHPEGWFFYVLTASLKRAFDKGRSHLQEPAMLFLLQGSQVFFSEAGEQSTFLLKNYDGPLAALRRCERDKHGKVLATTDSSELMYRITREVERQAGKPHHFSPEYIFAQEFTAHYEEFALYFPEFKRLKELSRVVVLIRVLNGVRESNQSVLSLLHKELAAVQQWQEHKTFPKGSDDKKKYREAYTETLKSVNQNVSTWRQELNYDTIVSQKKSEYRDLREKVGSLSLSTYSNEVNAVCQRMYDDTVRRYGGYVDHDAVWQQIDAERSNIASTLSSQKRSQVWDLFSSVGSCATINGFLNNNDVDTLAHEVTTQQLEKAKKDIGRSLSATPLEVEEALQGSRTAVKTIATRMTDKEFSRYLDQKKEHLQAQVSGRNRLEDEITEIGLGLQAHDVNLLGLCLWVPAAVNHCPSVANNTSRFVYGGVNLQPKIHFSKEVITSPNQVRLSTQQLRAASGATSSAGVLSGGASSSSGGAAPPPTGGGAGGNGSGKGPPSNRFVMLADRVSKDEARSIINKGNHSLTPGQIDKVKDALRSGRMNNVSIKYMNTGEVRVFGERPGHTEGYQRMSFGIDASGQRTRIVQTAFDDYGNLVHQKPGQSKNNLYDVKFPK